MATLTNAKAFKGILQVKSLPATPEKGYIYLVGDGTQGGNGTGIYFGTRYYGKTENSAELINLKNSITANTKSIEDIEAILGEWKENFTGNLATVAQAVVAVSGATEANTTNIATLSGTVADNLTATTKAIADAKSELLGNAGTNYNTLGKLEDEIQKVAQSVTDKNVSATGDAYVSASAEGNTVTVAATESTKASLALADSALQASGITTGGANGTIAVNGSDVAVKGLGSAAYTDANAYDVNGAAANALTAATKYTDDEISAVTDLINTVNSGRTYNITKTTTGLAENVREKYTLVDGNNNKAGEDILIYKDSSLKKVELSGQTLMFTYILADGSESNVGVNVSSFLLESEFGNGLEVIDHIVKVKVDSASESYLTVSNNGVKLSGINNKLDEKLNVSIFNGYTGSTNAKIDTLQSGKTDVSVFEAHTATTSQLHNKLAGDINGVKNMLTAHTQNFNTYSADTKTVLDGIDSRLSAITDNAVTSVASSANTINVSNTDGAVNVEVNTLSVVDAQSNGYIAIEDNGGALYGVMYYGGDDAE
jgi:hypothetical protein